MINKIINSEDPKFQSETISELVFDTTPTVNSFNTVTSDGVARAIAGASGEVPQVTENDNGKVLTAVYDAGGPAVEWAEAQGGSSYTAGDGIAIDNGEISIARDESGGIRFNDSGEVMLDYSTIVENSNGTLVETIDNDAVVGVQVDNPVPATSGANQGDVLTIGSNGPEWAAPSGGTDDTFYAIYGTTSYSDIAAAINAGKAVFLKDGGRILTLRFVNDSQIGFEGIVDALYYGDYTKIFSTILYVNTSNVWQTTYIYTYPEANQSDYGKMLSVGQNGVTWSTVNQVPASTSLDEDKVLTVNSSGVPVWVTPSGGGTSYTAGDGISIDNNEISAVLGNSSGGMQFDNDGIAIDWNYMESSSDGTLEAISDGVGGTSGIKVVNPVPDTTGASSGDVLTIGSSGPEWAAPSAGKPYTAGGGIDISESSLNKVISVKLGKGLVVSDDLLVSDTWTSGSTSPAIGVTDNIKQGNTCKVYLNVAGTASKTSQDTFTITASAAQAGLPIRLAFGSNPSGYGWQEIVSGYNLKSGSFGNTKWLVEGANSIDSLWYEANMWTGAYGLFPNSTEYDLTQVGLKANGTTYVKLYAWDTTNNVAVGDPLVAVNAKVVISTDATAKINFNLATNSGISFTSAGKLRVDQELPWFDPTVDTGKVLAINSSGYLQWMNPSDL